jgi:serine/threonine-protein kinase HipA
MDNISFIDAFLNGQLVGKLAMTPQSLCAFEYDTDYLKEGISISPLFIPLKPGLFVAKRDPFNGGFGVFDDSLPDGWGNLILDRFLQQNGINPYKLTLLQRLSLVGSTGRGALEFRPERNFGSEESMIDFNKLAIETEKILASEYTGDSLSTLYHYGGSSGGARPKIFVKIDNKEWLVKFKATNDPVDIGKTEYEYSLLAKECGIEMPETRLFEKKYFGVTRFDRTPKGKIHTISAAGLLNANYRIPSLDYVVLLKVCRQITLDMEQVYALFRQMVFNVAISNRDDHAKNFSFQLQEKQWKLCPAYDLLPGNGFNGFHTTAINGKGEPTLNDIMAVASEIGLNKQRAMTIIDEIITKCRDRHMLKFRVK